MRDNTHNFLMTFNTKSLQLSSLLDVKECFEIMPYNCFYSYSNILKDVIILVDDFAKVVFVVRESMENDLYIYKHISLERYGEDHLQYSINQASCCNNRSNEIILFFNAEIPDEFGDKVPILVYYDILDGKKYQKVVDFNGNDINLNVPIFFNKTGEEIYVTDEERQLNIFVYKSKVRSLKKICQLLVSVYYSEERLKLMILPRLILKDE